MKLRLADILKLALSTLYIKVRGKSRVITTYTHNDYTYKYSDKLNGIAVDLNFNCKQIKHAIYYEKWKFLSTIKYTYVVEAIKSVEGKLINKTVGSFPHIGMTILHSTKQPHINAINAMIDCFR